MRERYKIPKILEETKGKFVLINWKMVNEFARITGDNNPIHTDVTYARETIFQEPIAQGMLSLSLISALLGETYNGIIYKNQDTDFLKPIRLNTQVRAVIKCVAIKEAHSIYKNLEIIFHTRLEDIKGNNYIRGIANMFIWGEKT